MATSWVALPPASLLVLLPVKATPNDTGRISAMTDHTAPLAIALVTGAGAGFMQLTAQASPAISMIVPIVSALVGGAISYGILRGTVQSMERDLAHMREDLGQVFNLIRDASDRVARIEGKLDA